MPTDHQIQVRRVLIRMMLDLHEVVTSRGRPTEETLINFAIRLGQYEGRPVDASEIAAITTLPRSSVIRHLKELEKKGRAHSLRSGRRVLRYVPLTPETPDVERFYDEAEKIVRTACHELSKMDSSTARHET